MTAENLSSLVDSTPEPTGDNTPNNLVKVPLVSVLNALRNQRTQLVNRRKGYQKKKAFVLAQEAMADIQDIDAQIALLEAGPKNQSFQIPLREARAWGFGLMANGRWPKL